MTDTPHACSAVRPNAPEPGRVLLILAVRTCLS